jgi:hypothetical protein
MAEVRNAYSILIGKPEGKRSLVRLGHRWEDVLECILGKLGGRY